MMHINIPSFVLKVIRQLEKSGYEAYLVGGCVRDAIRGKVPHDFDLTTNALPDDMLKVFEDYTVLITGIQHGTVTVICDHMPVEVTTYRLDGVYSDHRHPDEVVYTNDLMEDLSRRDFTVNAMAYHPQKGLVDAFGGIRDLQNGIIRCVGDARKRFEEDALRIVRAMRFASVLDFSIEEKTAVSIHALHASLRFVSVERIYAELTKLLSGPAAGRILSDFTDVLPSAVRALDQVGDGDLKKAARQIRSSCPDTGIRYALLFAPLHTAGFSVRDAFLDLHADRAVIRDVQMLLHHAGEALPENEVSLIRLMQSLETQKMFERFVCLRRAVALEAGDTGTLDALARLGDEAKRLYDKKICLSVRDLAVNGNDLREKGFTGKAVGDALRTLLDAVTENKTENKKDALLAYLDIMER